MKQHSIIITETLETKVSVSANSPEQALNQVKEQYRKSDIILLPNDFKEVVIDYVQTEICDCVNTDFYGIEELVVKGSIDEGVMYLKSNDTLGVSELRCDKCNRYADDDFEQEFV